MSDALQRLADAIAAGDKVDQKTMHEAICGREQSDKAPAVSSVFGERYPKRFAAGLEQDRPPFMRNAYGKSGGETEHVAYAGFIHPENPSSGPYGGMSLVWFPSEEGSLIAFVVGTRGLSPDEGVLLRPGHRRRISSLRDRMMAEGVGAWSRQDPAAVSNPVPESVARALGAWANVFKRYGNEMYCLAGVPKDDSATARKIVGAFLDLYAYERGWEPMAAVKDEVHDTINGLNASWLATPEADDIDRLLRKRRFVVLQGPPGTGKSRLAEQLLKERFGNRGLVTQFHPSTTYEDFVAGLSPDLDEKALRFAPRKGHLMRAADIARKSNQDTLLVVDEINRADLGRVLGEAIYLFEADAGERAVRLAHVIDGHDEFALPIHLHVVATMNTADRSVAPMDLAIRRRFGFVTMMPDREVVKAMSTEMGLELFDALSHVFLEFAPDDALALLPGHSYFIAADDAALSDRFAYELVPLLDEYLREGYLGSATNELHTIRNRVADESRRLAKA
jgi:5-methylcytosine-specific restriction protein B